MSVWNERFSFDKEKAIEVMVFFAHKSPIPDIYHLAKVCYFADLLHLEKYGRPVFGDDYIKMDNGPVPSKLYNMFKDIRDGSTNEIYSGIEVNVNTITSQREYDPDEFSASDIECLEESISCHGNKSFSQLFKDSHDSAWNSAKSNRKIDYDKMLELLPNSKTLIEHLSG